MQAAGMAAMEAIVAATGGAAKVIRIGDRVGTLTEGLAADAIVVAGNPLEDLRRLERPRLVVQGGRVVQSAPG